MLLFFKRHIGWTMLSALGLAVILMVAHEILLQQTIRTVAVHVSGVPRGSQIDVSRAPGPKIFQHHSNPLTERRSDNTVTVRGSNLETIEVGTYPPATDRGRGGIHYLPVKKQYNVVGKTSINVRFEKFFEVFPAVGSSHLLGQGGVTDVSLISHADGRFANGYFGGHSLYPAGSTVTVTAPKVMGAMFAWWYVTNSLKNTSWGAYDFTTVKRTIQIKMTHPYDVNAQYVQTWTKTKKYPHAQGIVVEDMAKGQIAELIRKGHPPVVSRRIAQKPSPYAVIFPLSKGKTVSGRILITAPDGKTTVFESPFYQNLGDGDTFYF